MTDYYVMFWNLENLFDVENSTRRSEKLQRTIGRELQGWTADVLARKVSQLGSIIRQANEGRGPDVAGVCEVENRYALDLLTAELAPLGRDYRVAHSDTTDNRGIDVAFIYDAALLSAEDVFSHYIIKRSATRDLFQVNFRTNAGKLLVMVGNHWPSRMGGQYESEPYRIIAAETLAYFHQRIREVQQNDDVAVLAMGDFNDEPFDRAMSGYALSEQSRTKVTRARTARFLNLMWPILGRSLGTHYYNNAPQVLDQFLASKGLLTGKSGIRVDTASAEVLQFPEMIKSTRYLTPKRFGRGESIDRNGFSDHYPVVLRLSEG
jgi:endonuclease/exonuclease/phosphatase family metal-dependent hydrolase